MASSGSFNTGSCEGRYLTFSWSLSSQSIENNTSTISWKLVGAGRSGYVVVSEVKVVINGAQVYYRDTSNTVYCYQGTVVASGTTTISHNTDGSKSFSASVGAGIYQWAINCNGSGSWALTTIPRASSLSFGEFTMGTAGTMTINRTSSSFTHTISYGFGILTGTIVIKTANTSVSWTPSIDTFAGQLPNSTRGSGTLTLKTYSGSTQIGSNSYTFYLNVPSSVVPTVGTISLTPATINSRNILVQNKNKLTISVSGCSGGKGSAIKSYTFSGPGISTTGTGTSATTSTISDTGTLTYTVKVTDNRGRTASKTATITCYAWSAPYFKSFSAYRSNSSGTADDSGAYIKCSYSLGFSSVNGTNDVTVKIMYKKSSATSYRSVTSLTDSTLTSGSQILSSIVLDSTYTVYATITDNYSGSSSSQAITIFGASRVLNITSDGTGVAFGKMAESTKLLESRYRVKAPGLLSSRDGRTTTNINIASDSEHLGCLESFIVKSGNTGVPSLGDGHVAHFHWDNTGGYDAQLYLQNSTGTIMSRGCNSGTWGSWMEVQYKPINLYMFSKGNSGSIQFSISTSLSDYSILEIFYCDNNSAGQNCIRVYSPYNGGYGKIVDISVIEASPTTNKLTYIRRTRYVISGSDDWKTVYISPQVSNSGYVEISDTAVTTVIGTNHIKIFRVLGYK